MLVGYRSPLRCSTAYKFNTVCTVTLFFVHVLPCCLVPIPMRDGTTASSGPYRRPLCAVRPPRAGKQSEAVQLGGGGV